MDKMEYYKHRGILFRKVSYHKMKTPDLTKTSTCTIGPKLWDFTYLLACLRNCPEMDIVWQSNSPSWPAG